MIRRSPDGRWRSTLLEGQEWLDHEFGTAAAGTGDGCLLLKQVHSTRAIDASEWFPELEGDALSCCKPGVRMGVKTADCVPILLADPLRRVVAAVHAGWRGTAQDIAGSAVHFLRGKYGSDPADLLAALGPSIGPCCFEVGPEVAAQFRDLAPARRDGEGRTFMDLRKANASRLREAGLKESSIDWSGAPCTVCGGSEFHSWRRDRIAGARMYATILVRDAGAGRA